MLCLRCVGAHVPYDSMVCVFGCCADKDVGAMLDKVNRYRARWSPWFNFATDGRGTMDSRLTGNGCLVMTTDAGVPAMDAGTIAPDAGVEVDAGSIEPDAGEPAPVIDAGPSGPSKDETRVNIGTIRPGCGCNSGGVEVASLLAALTIFISRHRRA
jgi:hypothetical protein